MCCGKRTPGQKSTKQYPFLDRSIFLSGLGEELFFSNLTNSPFFDKRSGRFV